MKVACNYSGWFPVGRGVFQTPVWRDERAFRVYMSLLAAATHKEIIETVGSVSVRLLPGQLTASQAEICAMTGYDRNTVRNALGVLKREGAAECGVPHNRRFSVVSVHSFPFSRLGERESAGDGFTHDSLPNESSESHQPNDCDNFFDDTGFDAWDELDNTNRFSEKSPALYRNKEYKELNNKKKEKNILFSSSSILSILSLWRSARESKGEVYCEDPVTLDGAALMAELWFDSGKVTETQIAGAMAQFVHLVKTNETARFYTLKTLANTLGTYLEKPAVEVVRRFSWTFTCDTCGGTSAATFKETEPPGPYPCRAQVRVGVYCTGTAFPKCDSN